MKIQLHAIHYDDGLICRQCKEDIIINWDALGMVINKYCQNCGFDLWSFLE